jgi:hypothetical protein
MRIAERQILLCTPSYPLKRGFSWIFPSFINVVQHYVLHLRSLGFHCVGGCWDGIEPKTIATLALTARSVATRLDLIHGSYPSRIEFILFHNPFSLSNSLSISVFFPFFISYNILTKTSLPVLHHLSVHSMIYLIVSCFSFWFSTFHYVYFFLVLYIHFINYTHLPFV